VNITDEHNRQALVLALKKFADADPQQAAEFAFKHHSNGRIRKHQLIHILQYCINQVARGNGYAQRYGVPYPRLKAP